MLLQVHDELIFECPANEVEEMKAAAQGEVNQGDGAISGVHRADQVDVGRNAETLTGIGQRHVPLAIFQEQHQLAKDARDVATIDLVNDKNMGLIWIRLGNLAETAKDAGSRRIVHREAAVAGRLR